MERNPTNDKLTQLALEDACDSQILVVGSGFFGATVCEQIGSRLQRDVTLIDRRPTIGGNAYSEFDPTTGIEIHKYGSHLFHTSNQRVWDYVNSFTAFNDYRHHVWTVHKGRTYSMPISLATITSFLGRHLTPDEARSYVASQSDQEAALGAQNLESKAIALVGRDLYEAFVRGYTAKQWQTEPTKLPADIISRLPVRFNFNTRYFGDRWEGLPLDGYGAWFSKMLASPRIRVHTGVDFFDIREQIAPETLVIYTGPIDEYFEYACGRLTWRTLDFDFDRIVIPDFQGTSVVNYADEDVSFTRIHEFQHLHPERVPVVPETVIAREFSRFAELGDEPYYPVNSENDRLAIRKYRKLADAESKTIFGGRLGTYHYLDMHMAIASGLVCADKIVSELST